MVDIPRSSFIPKESIGMTPDRVRRGRTFHVFGFIGTAILIGSLLGAGLVFFLRTSTESRLEEAQVALEAQKSLFNAEYVRELRQFDRQLEAADVLLKNHISPLRIFKALENETKKRIQFTSFSLERTSMSDVIVSLAGNTEAFKTLALQEMGFAENAFLKDIVFSEVATQDVASDSESDTAPTRGVTFTLTGAVDTSLIRYDGTSYANLSQVRFGDDGGALVLVTDGGDSNERVLGANTTLVNE